MDFWYAYQVARAMKIPYYLSVHDDLAYALQGKPELNAGLTALREVWQEAAHRFVISDGMGKEYCRRYGKAEYDVVTDGLENVPVRVRRHPRSSLRVYFMGLVHRSYAANLRVLLNALEMLQSRQPQLNISITCRCGSLPKDLSARFPVRVLPFGTEQDILRDLDDSDLLYLPLPFDSEYDLFVKYSLSTKMITYLGSGLPIFYHGPADAAAGRLLASHDAACMSCSLDPEQVADHLLQVPDAAESVVSRAAMLASDEFLLDHQRDRFIRGLNRQQEEHARIPVAAAI
jgi:hypothetical protein